MMGIPKELHKIILVVIKFLQDVCKVQIQSSYKMFVKYNYKVLDDDYVNNLKELF